MKHECDSLYSGHHIHSELCKCKVDKLKERIKELEEELEDCRFDAMGEDL